MQQMPFSIPKKLLNLGLQYERLRKTKVLFHQTKANSKSPAPLMGTMITMDQVAIPSQADSNLQWSTIRRRAHTDLK